MKRKLKLYSVLSLLAGGLLLLSFFVNIPVISQIRASILTGTECLLMLILLLSLLDSLLLHIREIGAEGGVRIIHIVSFAVFLAVLILGLLKGSTHAGLNKLIYRLQQVMESAAAALVCIGLIYALYRLPRQHITRFKSAYVIGLIFFLLIYSGLDRRFHYTAPLKEIVNLMKCIPPSCLAGLFLGLALGAAVAGLRRIAGAGDQAGDNQ